MTTRDAVTVRRAGRRGGAVAPLLLVAVGLALLALNQGWLEWDMLVGIGQLWPLALVAAGADILLRGRYRPVLVAVTLLVAVLIYLALATGIAFGGLQPQTTKIEQALAGAERAQVIIRTTVASLRLEAAPQGQILASGTIGTSRGERVDRTFAREGDTARFVLQSERVGSVFPFTARGRRWDLTLADRVPTALVVETGVGESVLNLSNMELTSLHLNSGVGSTLLTLPGSGRYTVEVTAGVGSTTIRIPDAVAVRVDVSRGVGALTVPDGLVREGDSYISNDFATYAHQAQLRVSQGVGELVIERIR